MKAIPTSYRGTNFRSRIEARWAVFFDLVEWPWEYEPIDLEGYIPDFILTFDRPGWSTATIGRAPWCSNDIHGKGCWAECGCGQCPNCGRVPGEP